MNRKLDVQLPDFVREALAGEGEPTEAESAAPDLRGVPPFHELFPAVDTGTGAERLLAAISQAPLKYAPFFSRVAELWDLSEDRVSTVFERAKDESVWRKPSLRGLRVIDVEGGPKTHGADVYLVRFDAGVSFPKHRHPGPEALLVLEGDYTDSVGRYVGPGDLHTMAPGSEHSFKVGSAGPCVAAAVQAGREFTGPLMRVYAKFFG